MAEEKLSPISAAKPPAVNPLGSATAAHASTLKLKPVIRKPAPGGVPRPAMPSPSSPLPAHSAAAPAQDGSVRELKNVTQKLKDITQQLPQQAILRKTGRISADQSMTEAQKQASKSRTARISLSDAVGAAPVSNEAAPMKTIRIKRPSDLVPPPSPGEKKLTAKLAPAIDDAAKAVPADEAVTVAADGPADKQTSITQRKTLKISRPGASVRPGVKLGLKKPGAEPKAESAGEAGDAVADIPDIPDIPSAPAPRAAIVSGAPKNVSWLDVTSFIVQYAACVTIGIVGWMLYSDLTTKWF